MRLLERMVRRRDDLESLRDMVAQAHRILLLRTCPEGRSVRARELLNAAVQLTDNMTSKERDAADELAAALGMKGGKNGGTRF